MKIDLAKNNENTFSHSSPFLSEASGSETVKSKILSCPFIKINPVTEWRHPQRSANRCTLTQNWASQAESETYIAVAAS